jgi:ABC-type phosphate transport system substrate-binding protein
MFRLRPCQAIQIRPYKLALVCIALTSLILLSVIHSVIAADLTAKASDGNSPNSNFNREQLREIFFARQTRWPDGNPIRAFVLPDQHPLHVRFSKELLGVYPYQLRAAWDRMIYSGTGVPPTVVENVEEMRSKINQTPGGIGYLDE